MREQDAKSGAILASSPLPAHAGGGDVAQRAAIIGVTIQPPGMTANYAVNSVGVSFVNGITSGSIIDASMPGGTITEFADADGKLHHIQLDTTTLFALFASNQSAAHLAALNSLAFSEINTFRREPMRSPRSTASRLLPPRILRPRLTAFGTTNDVA